MDNFEKVNYIDGTTVIMAKNLNDIQDALIDTMNGQVLFSDDGNGNITLTTREVGE